MKPEDVCQHLAARAAGAPPPLVEARVEAADGVADPRVQEEEAIFRNISSSYFDSGAAWRLSPSRSPSS
jgi:hypothetical protein